MFRVRRFFKFLWQRLTRGWTDEVAWNLDTTIAQFIAPRLRRFKEVNNGFPSELGEEGWDKALDEMIWTFEFLGSDNKYNSDDKGDFERANKGLTLFAKHFGDLWW